MQSLRPHSRIRQSAPLAGCVLALLVAAESAAQQVESLFLTGQNAEGYYVPSSGLGKLDVAVLASLGGERPIAVGARIEISESFASEKKLTYANTTALMTAGRQGSGGRDQWFLPALSWIISCDPEGGTIHFDGKLAGKSPVDFIIQVGVIDAAPQEQAREGLSLIPDSGAESSKKRVVCGRYASLPKP